VIGVKMHLTDKNILIFDDNEVTRHSLKRIFEADGATVYSAGHLGKGITILAGLMSKNTPPALIVADVRLPGAYGYEVLRGIQDVSMEAKVPVLLMSSGLGNFALRRASLYGVVGYLCKPVLIENVYKFSIEIIASYEKKKGLHVAMAA
jgi:CheY-like chemotaxis protein